ncbi:glycerol-3-phosphate 1-O-acyltransferase PlsY [Halomonas shantousis]
MTLLSPFMSTCLLMSAGYLSGSLLGAVWVCRIWKLRDPRFAGSCNPGFSNVLRVHGAAPAAVTLAVDAFKAMPVLWLAKWEGLPLWAQGLIGLAVLLGHSYPPWHHFRGGKAVASAFGVLLVLVPTVALLCAACWALLAWRGRTAAMASLASAAMAPLASYVLAREATPIVSLFSALVLVRHAWNLRHPGSGVGLALSRRGADSEKAGRQADDEP